MLLFFSRGHRLDIQTTVRFPAIRVPDIDEDKKRENKKCFNTYMKILDFGVTFKSEGPNRKKDMD